MKAKTVNETKWKGNDGTEIEIFRVQKTTKQANQRNDNGYSDNNDDDETQ